MRRKVLFLCLGTEKTAAQKTAETEPDFFSSLVTKYCKCIKRVYMLFSFRFTDIHLYFFPGNRVFKAFICSWFGREGGEICWKLKYLINDLHSLFVIVFGEPIRLFVDYLWKLIQPVFLVQSSLFYWITELLKLYSSLLLSIEYL